MGQPTPSRDGPPSPARETDNATSRSLSRRTTGRTSGAPAPLFWVSSDILQVTLREGGRQSDQVWSSFRMGLSASSFLILSERSDVVVTRAGPGRLSINVIL